MSIIRPRGLAANADVTRWQGFYSLAQVSRISGVPSRTLGEWRQRGIIRPSLDMTDETGKVIADGYSYADLTIIRLMWALRKDRLDFKSAGVALRHLYERLGPVRRGWADARVYFVGNRIFAERPADEWGTTVATQFGQTVETRLFGDLFDELRELEEGASFLVPREYRPYVDISPSVMGGEPVVRGTRLPTAVLAGLALKRKLAHLVRIYSPLPREFIEKAIEYEKHLDRRAAAPAEA